MKVLGKLCVPLLALCVLSSCIVSYKLNGASIDYNTVKTITLEPFANRSPYQWAPMTAMLNESISDMYARQTKLKQVKSNGDLVISGEITGYDQVNKSISADGYSSMVELRMTVKVKFVNNTKHEDDFERQFSAAREYDSKQQFCSRRGSWLGRNSFF